MYVCMYVCMHLFTYLFIYFKAAIEKCCILLRCAGDVLGLSNMVVVSTVNATTECTLNPAGIYIYIYIYIYPQIYG